MNKNNLSLVFCRLVGGIWEIQTFVLGDGLSLPAGEFQARLRGLLERLEVDWRAAANELTPERRARLMNRVREARCWFGVWRNSIAEAVVAVAGGLVSFVLPVARDGRPEDCRAFAVRYIELMGEDDFEWVRVEIERECTAILGEDGLDIWEKLGDYERDCLRGLLELGATDIESRRAAQATGDDARARIVAAIYKLGPDVKPAAIRREAKTGKQRTLDILRELEREGKYSGFTRKRPMKYTVKQVPKGSTVLEP